MKHTLIVLGALIVTLFLIFYPSENRDAQIFVTDAELAYQEIISQYIENENVVLSSYDSALHEISEMDGASVYDVHAEPFTKHDSKYNFVPHIAQTVVIAIDRDMTDVQIDEFSDLLDTKEHVTFDLDDRFDPNDWGTLKAQHIILSMARALDEDYDITAVGEFMRFLWDDGDRFHYQDMWQPIVVTYDSVAASYIKDGRNLEVIIPKDGTITLEYGLLYHGEEPTFSPDIDTALIEAGYRLPDGRADPTLYPTDYSNASAPADTEAYRNAVASLGSIIRRTTFNADNYNFANILEYTVLFSVFLFVLIVYTFSILHRVTDKYIATALVISSVSAIFFLFVGLIKYLVEDNIVIETLLWYSFYIPMFTMTASLVYVMMRAEHTVRPMNIKRAIKWFKWYVFAEIAVLILIFTNHLHEWVFVVTDYQHSYHAYNFGYAIVLFIMYLGILITLVTLIGQCIHAPRKVMFLFPASMVALMFIYSSGYIFDFEPVLNFEISFAISGIAIIFSELCMISRILPLNKGHKTLFLHSSLAMQIKDRENNTKASSIVTMKTDENYVLRQWEIAGGTFLYFEDQTSLNNMNKSLLQINEMRRKNNRLLLQKSKLQADLATLAVQREIYESIDKILLDGTEKIEQLSKAVNQNDNRKKAMAKINFLACSMKRACMFRINLLYLKSQQVNILLNSLNELVNYSDSLELAITVSCRTTKDVKSSCAVSMYSFYTSAIEAALANNAKTLLVQIYEQDDKIVMSLLGDVPLFSEELQEKVASTLHKEMSNLHAKAWEETEIYLIHC